jgi:protein-tyrosine phosphatase
VSKTEEMIDIHCHILPGMDDGPGTFGVSLDMCRAAAADGIRTIVATPHFKPGIYESKDKEVFGAIDLLETAAREDGLALRILPGAEVAISPEMPAYLRQVRHLTINNNGRYFLVELPPMSVPPNWEGFLLSVMSSGFVPIIAHPERNVWFMNHPDAFSSAVGRGLMVQITAMSILGGFGPEVRDFSDFLLRRNLVHLIASDAHSPDFRRPALSEAVRRAAGIVGRERAEALVNAVPEAIIEGRDIPALPPLGSAYPENPQKKTWFARLFRSGDREA